MSTQLKDLGINIPEILLPKRGTDLCKWAIVACDQYTSQPDYWNQVKNLVADYPSTLHLIFPEVYLEENSKEERIKNINGNMKKYLAENILLRQNPGFVYVDRKTTHAQSRKGLVMTVDLEKYDYSKGSQTLIRATEGTVIDRLPPRIEIRENASIELPHIMLLIDDPGKTVIEPLAEKVGNMKMLYDFDLMMNGGHIKGYMVEDEEMLSSITSALEKLVEPSIFKAKYGVDAEKGVLLFAAGDGNHSLAAAKGHWENLKKTLTDEETEDHPARYALVEVVNVHDAGLEFEPIHRVVFNIKPEEMLNKMVEYFGRANAHYKTFTSKAVLKQEISALKYDKSSHVIPFISKDFQGVFVCDSPKCNLEVGTLQAFLDEYAKTDDNIKIDYIHGDEVVDTLGSKEGNMGFYLPSMDKNDLFKTVVLDGVLPRKTFSMGEAEEKRFYLECREISKIIG